MFNMLTYWLLLLTTLIFVSKVTACKTAEWRNMTMEEILLKSDVVVYGKDVGHGKFRIPEELDARFDVYCVIKTGEYHVPGQVIIENIREGDTCSGVKEQTSVNREYIIGLTRQFSGFMRYSDVNPLQASAFPATGENFEAVIATCGLDQWEPPHTGAQNLCPTPNKPRFCTKVRFDMTNLSTQLAVGFFQTLFQVILTLGTLFFVRN